MKNLAADAQLKCWIRSQHLVCSGTNFIFETVDHSLIERFEACLNVAGGQIITVKVMGNWPMGPRRCFKILRATAQVPKPLFSHIVNYWASHGSMHTRYSEISQ
ncbi:MAG: CpeR family transcriptional regulator [Cyanobacteria bacterium]|nr:CpeR family transcriptional regulator [Cyanobacteria bacterium bin.51]